MRFWFQNGFCRSTQPDIAEFCETALVESGLANSLVTLQSLQRLGDILKQLPEERQHHNAMIFVLTDFIQRHLNKVSRFYVAGSYGRRVSVGPIHIELITFLIPQQQSFKNSNQPEFFNYTQHLEGLASFLQSHKAQIADRSNVQNVRVNLHLLSQYVRGGEKNMTLLSPPCIHLIFGDSTCITVYLAPSLSNSPDEQKQIAYRHMKLAYETGNLNGVVPLFPSLSECCSADIAEASPAVRSFIRLCSAWVQMIPDVKSLRPYAFEVLAYLTVQDLAQQEAKYTNSTVRLSNHNHFDYKKAFHAFLTYCTNLSELNHLNDIYSPATFFSPWGNYTRPLLVDHYNPYDNLLMCMADSDIHKIQNTAKHCLSVYPSWKNDDTETSEQPNITMQQLFDCATLNLYPNYKNWIGRLCFSLLSMLLVGCSAILIAFYLRDDFEVLFEKWIHQIYHYIGELIDILSSYNEVILLKYSKYKNQALLLSQGWQNWLSREFSKLIPQ